MVVGHLLASSGKDTDRSGVIFRIIIYWHCFGYLKMSKQRSPYAGQVAVRAAGTP